MVLFFTPSQPLTFMVLKCIYTIYVYEHTYTYIYIHIYIIKMNDM